MPPQHTPAGLVTALVIIMLAMLIFSPPPQRLNVGVHWAHDSAASGRWCRENIAGGLDGGEAVIIPAILTRARAIPIG